MSKELQGDMIGSAPTERDIPFIPFSPLQVLWKALPGMVRAQRNAAGDIAQTPEFVAGMPGWCQTMRAALQNCLDASSLLSLWKQSIKPGVVRACSLLRSVALTMADPATKLRLELTNLVGETDSNTILSNLSGASGDLASLGPLLGLAKVRDGKLSGEAYMECYGHRGLHEMELFAPGADEDPDWLEKQLGEFSHSALDGESLLANQRAKYLSAWQRFEAKFPNKVKTTRGKLDKVSAAARDREAVRSEVTRVARLVRGFLLRTAEITGLGEGIFFLSLDEMCDVLAGDTSSVVRIPARREAYDKYRALPPYPPIIVGNFDPFTWVSNPNRRSDYFDARKTRTPTPLGTISGFAGAAGVVEGIVRRVDKPEDGWQIQPGEILVTVTTNVGWTPLFPRLAAIVTDVGAPLSHAAIVARELGIPAVVGCGNATIRLKTGDRIRVDGGRGTVEMIEQGQFIAVS